MRLSEVIEVVAAVAEHGDGRAVRDELAGLRGLLPFAVAMVAFTGGGCYPADAHPADCLIECLRILDDADDVGRCLAGVDGLADSLRTGLRAWAAAGVNLDAWWRRHARPRV